MAIGNARERSAYLSVAFVDLDGLGELNERHGWATGSILVAAVEMALDGVADQAFRLGGDEYMALLSTDIVDAVRPWPALLVDAVASTAVASTAGEPVQRHQRGAAASSSPTTPLVSTTACAGAALWSPRPTPTDSPPDAGELVERAATALRTAKRTGRGSVVWWERP